jgi:hypothetical protein
MGSRTFVSLLGVTAAAISCQAVPAASIDRCASASPIQPAGGGGFVPYEGDTSGGWYDAGDAWTEPAGGSSSDDDTGDGADQGTGDGSDDGSGSGGDGSGGGDSAGGTNDGEPTSGGDPTGDGSGDGAGGDDSSGESASIDLADQALDGDGGFSCAVACVPGPGVAAWTKTARSAVSTAAACHRAQRSLERWTHAHEHARLAACRLDGDLPRIPATPRVTATVRRYDRERIW